MEKEIVKVYRHNKPTWEFIWDDEHQGLVHKARKNIYKLFFENPADSFKPIWIGLLVNNGTAWVTWEKEMGAKCIQFCGSKVFFD
jgi:hypothetical protein